MADVILRCEVCKTGYKAQARMDEPDKPVQTYPEICLKCWREGWRYEGPFEGDPKWKIYKV